MPFRFRTGTQSGDLNTLTQLLASNVGIATDGSRKPHPYDRPVDPIGNGLTITAIVAEGIKPYLADNGQAWQMQPDGAFKRRKRGNGKAHCAQVDLLKKLAR